MILTKRCWLAGFTIATLVFFPLLNALAVEGGYWLHWRSQDTVETLLAWMLLAIAVGASLVAAHRTGPRLGELINAVWLGVGGLFLTGALVKMGAVVAYADHHRAAAPMIAAALLSLGVAGAAWAVSSVRRTGRTHLLRLTLVLSPLVVVFLMNLGRAQLEHRELPASTGWHPSASESFGRNANRPLLIVLLFDELSADYLYGEHPVDLTSLPSLKGFIEHSRIHANVYLPGGNTGAAIPSLFGDRASLGGLAPAPPFAVAGGLLEQARQQRMDTRVMGWHLDYCAGFGSAATRCSAVSSYNARTLDDRFSLINPLWSNLTLLPSEFPFGLLKVRPAVWLHAATFEHDKAWFRQQIQDVSSDFIYVHVNVPHIPFLADDYVGSARSRFLMTQKPYVQQLRYVDEFVAFVDSELGKLKPPSRPVNVVIMSDHNARWLTAKDRHEHVTFLVRDGVRANASVDDRRADASDLLAQLMRGESAVQP